MLYLNYVGVIMTQMVTW